MRNGEPRKQPGEKNVRINVDSDGVVYDMIPVLKRRVEASGKKDLYRIDGFLPEPTIWNLEEWGFQPSELGQLFADAAITGLFRNGMAIDGAIDGLHALCDAGHDVRIVTDKNTGLTTWAAMQDMIGWYGKFKLLDKLDIVFAHDGKNSYPADVVIDDKPDLGWVQHGAINLLYNQTYNQEAFVYDTDNSMLFPSTTIKRVADWTHIRKVLKV